MSDVPQGEGWWQASDGKWYAPELHPDAPPKLPPGPETAAAAPPVVDQPVVSPAPQPSTWNVPPAEPQRAPAVEEGTPSPTAWVPKAIIVLDLAIIIITIGLVLING
jgi:hypothetical protein